MIKFRCEHCSQKLGVPMKYAGRRVRCSKCKEPVKVPAPAPAEEQPAAPQAPDTDIFTDFEDSADDREARRLEAIQAAGQERRQRKAKAVKFSPKSAKEKSSPQSASGPNKSFSMASLADMVPSALGFPLSLLSSLLAIAITTGIWVFASRSTQMAMGYMALVVFAGAAFGLRLFMVNRGLLLGMLGLLIGLAGLGAAKYAIAQYVIKDYYVKSSNEEILKNMDKILADAAAKDKGQTESVKPYALNGTYQVCTALLYLVDEDKLDPVKARGWMIPMLKGTSPANPFSAIMGSSSSATDTPELNDQDKEIFSKVSSLIFDWDEEKKLLGMTKKYFPVLQLLIAQADHQDKLANPDRSMKFCMAQSFGPLDAIWILVGMGMCFAILTFD